MLTRTGVRRALSAALLALCGCGLRSGRGSLEETPLPNNAIALSQMMRELSAIPGFSQQVVDKLSGVEKSALPLSPGLLHLLRALVLGRQWQKLDSFPGFTARHLSESANEAERLAEKYFPEKRTRIAQYLDVGSFALDRDGSTSFDAPPPQEMAGATHPDQEDFGAGVVAGDAPDPALIGMHAQSLQLALALNRLSVNPRTGLADGTFHVQLDGLDYDSPEALFAALQRSGHTVEVRDRRYFANFGHLHYQGRDVVMPFWINAQVWVPGTLRRLLVPVSHTELEISVHGPKVNALLAYYFGVEGKAEFRTTDLKNQAWVMGSTKHLWTGADTQTILRLLGEETAAYARAHVEHPELPFGGYYALGVCQDSVATIETAMTGKTTMFPLTAEPRYFDADPRSAEIAALFRRLPSDRRGLPSLERVLGTLPVDSPAQLPFPRLRADVERVEAAQAAGDRLRRHSGWLMLASLAAVIGAGALLWRRKHPAR